MGRVLFFCLTANRTTGSHSFRNSSCMALIYSIRAREPLFARGFRQGDRPKLKPICSLVLSVYQSKLPTIPRNKSDITLQPPASCLKAWFGFCYVLLCQWNWCHAYVHYRYIICTYISPTSAPFWLKAKTLLRAAEHSPSVFDL